MYEKIILQEVKYKNSKQIIECKSFNNDEILKKYKLALLNLKSPCELVGNIETQGKPYFDVDFEIKSQDEDNNLKDKSKELLKIEEWLSLINEIFPNKNVKIYKRNPRKKGNQIKFSYHFVVQDTRITAKNIKKLIIKNGIDKYVKAHFDDSVYSKNRGLYSIFTNNKINTEWDRNDPHKNLEYINIPHFYAIKKINNEYQQFYEHEDDFNVTDYCVTYIKYEFEDFDKYIEEDFDEDDAKMKYDDINEIDIEEEDDEDEDKENDTNSFQNNLEEYLNHLSITRIQNYETWHRLCFAIINMCKKRNIPKSKIYTIIHTFSSKSKKYKSNKVEDWLNANYEIFKINKKGYGFTYLIHTCLKEDDEYYYETNFSKTYEGVKKIWDKKIFKCKDPVVFIEINDRQDEINQKAIYLHTTKELLEKYKEVFFFEKKELKPGKIAYIKKEFFKEWIKDHTKKIYDTLTFKPFCLGEKLNRRHFNLFKGYRASKLPEKKDYEAIKPILWHIENIMCNGNNEHYNWVLKYFAQIVKNPKEKTGVVLIFKSPQGAGKNIIIDMIANGIIGDECSVSTSNPEQVFFGNFNALLANKTMAICNEAGNKLRDCLDRIKDTSTAPDIHIEKKGKDAIKFDNFVNILATTNNDYPIVISTDDRRVCWLECSSEKKGNVSYFKNLVLLCQNDKIVSSFYHYLTEMVEIEPQMNFQETRPITDEYKRIQQIHLANPIKFLLEYQYSMNFRKSTKEDAFVYLENVSEFYKAYKNFCLKCGFKEFTKDPFLFKIMNKESQIEKCIYKGCDNIRIKKKPFVEWLKQYQNLETKKLNIVYNDEDFDSNFKDQKIDPDIKYEFVESDNESDLSENTTDTNSEK